jgi:Holliday junction DNA helicase RuvA
MYDHFEGKIALKTPTYTVINCAGVGYHLNISLNTFSKLPDSGNYKLFAHLAVREDAMVLFGFAEESEREMFRQLISVSGVGPTTARMILSSMTPDEVAGAVAVGDVGALKAVKGIGEKSAQRIIVDLKGKINKEGATGGLPFTTDNKMRDEALTALVMLGFARNAAEKAVDKSLRTEGNAVSVEHLIKMALKNL